MGKPLAPASTTPRNNRLLAALPAADYEELLPSLEPVPLPLGAALYEPGSAQEHVYFPASAIVSLLYVLQDGSSAEIAAASGLRRSWPRIARKVSRERPTSSA
jgi:hypothetical protein